MSKLSVLVEERIRRAVERARKQAKVERARKATPDEKACSFDGCGRVAHSRGLCHAHYMQQYRSGKLTPVMERAEGPLVRLPGLKISKRAAKRLQERGPSLYRAAQAVIENWAKRAA